MSPAAKLLILFWAVRHGVAGAGDGGGPSHLARHSAALRVTLLAALLRLREREITDALVDLAKLGRWGINAHMGPCSGWSIGGERDATHREPRLRRELDGRHADTRCWV